MVPMVSISPAANPTPEKPAPKTSAGTDTLAGSLKAVRPFRHPGLSLRVAHIDERS